jgi:alpha-glucosidase
MRIIQHIISLTPNPHGLDASLEDGFTLRIRAMGEHLLRITVAPSTGLPVPRTWMIAPEGDTPWEGRDREDMAGFSPPKVTHDPLPDGGHRLTAGAFRLTLTGSPLRLAVEQQRDGAWHPWVADRETGGFALTDKSTKLRHFQARAPADRYFGLGDKTGPLDRHGRRFRILQLDALGYDAEIGDPLYKHVPFMIAQTGAASQRITGGMFYDTLTPLTFDLGCERSNYHGLYRYVEAEEAACDLWLIAGPDVAAVTERFTLLTGRPALPPRWSFGFAFTSMHHADDANAQSVIAAFADRCRAEGIPISAVHFGSGYSSRGKRRYVFTWNSEKFPDPKALFAKLTAMELPTVANLKPVLIDDHPDYASVGAFSSEVDSGSREENATKQKVKADGGFVTAPDGTPVLEQFWDGMGSYLDFTNPETISWWQERFKAQVLDVGFTAGWNDNNEYEIGRDGSTATGFGTPLDAPSTRPLHALLMTRATFEATQARAPNLRPYTITRAGPAGLQRYAETWTGDNATSWHTLKWNLRNGLSLALSGQSNVGHDIGGFTGARPDAELLCRFIEMMALHPRAVMNSWKPDVAPDWQAATHPWTHPEVLPQIRAALNLRTTFMPLMYTLAHLSHQTGAPIIRPLFYDFPDDPAAYADQDAMMLGADVLFSPVVTEGAREKAQYLPPAPHGWVEYHSGAWHSGGQVVTVPTPLGQPPVFIRAGAALLLAAETPVIKPQDAPARRLYVALGDESGTGSGRHIEDDGISWDCRRGGMLDLALKTQWDAKALTITLNRIAGHWPVPDAASLTLDVPGLSERKVNCISS